MAGYRGVVDDDIIVRGAADPRPLGGQLDLLLQYALEIDAKHSHDSPPLESSTWRQGGPRRHQPPRDRPKRLEDHEFPAFSQEPGGDTT